MPAEVPVERFYGESLKQRAEPNFCLAERSYPPFCQTPRHVHAKPLFSMVLNGAYYVVHSGRTHFCPPATMLFHAAQQSHLERFERCGGRFLVVEMDPAWLTRVCDSFRVRVECTAVHEGAAVSMLGAKLYKEFHARDAASSLVIEGLVSELVGEVSRAERMGDRRPPRWLERVREMLREQYASRLSLSEIAAAAGIHPVHLAQSFRKYYRCTLGEYVRTLRIEYACRELTFSRTPLAEIARDAGFADQSHFARTFKQMVGVPPSRFRQTSRS